MGAESRSRSKKKEVDCLLKRESEFGRGQGNQPALVFFLLSHSHTRKKKHPAPLLSRAPSPRTIATMASSLATSVRGVRVAPTQQVRIAFMALPGGTARGAPRTMIVLFFFFVVVFKEERVELFSSFFDESQFARDDD